MEVRPIDANQIHYTRLLSDKGLDMELAAKCVVDNIPTLDYEPVRHGEWIIKSDDNSFGVCSWCNRSDHIDPIATHCRYCGTKMDGGKEDG